MTEAQFEELTYLKEQILVLTDHAIRDTTDKEILRSIINKETEITEVLNNPIPANGVDGGEVFDALKDAHITSLRWLSSLVDKTKGGGWIADRSAVYRVESHGRGYHNTDLISISMADRDYNGADGLFKRAREVAQALNAAYDDK
jgi:hypothetical protein